MNKNYFDSERNTALGLIYSKMIGLFFIPFLPKNTSRLKFLYTFLVLVLLQTSGFGATYYSRVITGNFATLSSWSTSPTGNPTNNTALVNGDIFIIQNGHTITVTANIRMSDITVQAGGVLIVGGFNFRVDNNTSISGSLIHNNTTGSKSYRGLVTINSGGLWNNSGNSAIEFRGGITNSGTFTAGTGVHTFNTNAQALIGNLAMPSVTVTGVNLTNNGTLIVNTALSGSGIVTNTAAGVLNIGGTSTISTFNATAIGNTVNYSGAGNQTVKATAYDNLIISGSATKTAAGNIIVNNDFTITGGTFALNNATSYSLTILGNYNQTGGIFDFNAGTTGSSNMTLAGNFSITTGVVNSMFTSGNNAPNGIITFNGGSVQTLNMPKVESVSWIKYIVNASSEVKLASDITLTSANVASQAPYTGDFIVNGIIDFDVYKIYQSGGVAGSGVFKLNAGAALKTKNANGIDGSVLSINMDRTFDPAANYVFNGTSAQITSAGMPATVNDLSFNNSAGITISKATTITNNFSIASGTKANLGTFTHPAKYLTLGSNGVPSGSYGSSSSSATFKNNSYFAATTGIVNVGTASCTAGYWTGGTSVNWNIASNWCSNTVPTAATNVVIPAGTPYMPTIASATTAVANNLTIDASATLTLANNVSALLNVKGDFTNNGILTAGVASIVTFDGASTSVIQGTSTTVFGNLTINKTAGVTMVTNSSKAFAVSSNLMITQGNLILTAIDNHYIIGNNLTVAAAGTLTHNVNWDTAEKLLLVSGNLDISGAFSYSGVARSHIQMNGVGKTIRTGTAALSVLTLANASGTISANGSVIINDNFWPSFNVAGGTFATAGNTITANAAVLNAGGTLLINGGTLNVTGGLYDGFNGAFGLDGVITLAGGGILNADFVNIGDGTRVGTFNHTGGTANIGNLTINATGSNAYVCVGTPTINISGNWTNNKTFTAANSTVNFIGTAQTITNTNTFYNIALSGSGTKTFSNTTTINNNLSIGSGVIAKLSTGLTHSATTLTLAGTGTPGGSWGSTTSSATNKNNTYFAADTGIINVSTVSCTAGYWTGLISTDWNTASNWCTGVPTAATNVVIPAGVPNMPAITGATALANNLTINASATLTVTNNLNISGNFVNSGTFTAVATSTTSFVGTAQTVAGVTYGNLTLSGSGTKILSANTIINNITTISSGVVVNLNAINTHTTGALVLNGVNQVGGTWGNTGSGATNINSTYFTGSGRISVPTNSAIDNDFASYGTTGDVGGTIGEYGGAFTLTAPVGSVLINVKFASYGTPTGTSPNFVLGSCNAATSKTNTINLLGNTSWSFNATSGVLNGIFGDPCVGTSKTYSVVATYSQPICADTSPGAITINGSTPTGGNGAYTYLWEVSITSATSGYATASGTNNGKNYTVPAGISQTTWYRRTITSGTYTSNTIVIVQVNKSPSLSTPTVAAISGTTTICAGASTTLTVSGGSLSGFSTAGDKGGYAEWFTGSCGGTSIGTGNSITVTPASTTTYYVRLVLVR